MWNGQFAPALERLRQRLADGADPAEPMPMEYVRLSLGNQCTLACRMCNGTYSSRIETDAVHGRWAPAIDRRGEVVWSDYIRHPARWSVVERNLRRVLELTREHPNLKLQIATVVQAYNSLDLVDLLRFADGLSLGCFLHVLDDPPPLRLRVLPQDLRVEAARRLRAYAESRAESPAEASNRIQAGTIARHLEGLDESPDASALRQSFVAFTRELDASRRQSLAESIPGLAALLQ